jgi:putative ABC transport system substrate-binding protein
LAVVRVGVNLSAARQLNLTLDDQLLAKCRVFHGVASRLGRPAKVVYVQLVESSTLDQAAQGVFEGLSDAGLATDRDLTLRQFSAQGDLSQLPQIFQSALATSPDLIITCTTPAMIAAARSTSSVPIVFTVASEPSAVGVHPVGERRANLTGVFDDPPIAQLLDLAQRREGTLKTVGTIWNPAEPNSEISVKRLRSVCQQRGLELIERNAPATNELVEVTSAICQTSIDILVISADNVTSSGFPAIHSVAQRHKIPIYCTEPDLVAAGAAGAVGVNFYDWGRQSALLAARVLAGEDLNTIPPEKVSSIQTVTPQN